MMTVALAKEKERRELRILKVQMSESFPSFFL